MTTTAATTEVVVGRHLQAFLDGRGVAAVVADYAPGARFCTESRVYRGEQEIGEFFTGFLAALPEDAMERFTLRSLQVDGDLALITWSVGDDIPLGTDTFVVRDGAIVAQTFAMHAVAPAAAAPPDDDRVRTHRR